MAQTSPVPKLIACGWAHTVLVSDAGYFGFGSGKSGELGHEFGYVQFQARSLKLPVPELKNGVVDVQLAAGQKHTYILHDGIVYSTGASDNGRLGHEQPHGRLRFGPSNEKIAFITSGPDHGIAIAQNGFNLYTWGLTTPNGAGSAASADPSGTVDDNADPSIEMTDMSKASSSSAAAAAANGTVATTSSASARNIAGFISRPVLFNILDVRGTAKQIAQVACGCSHAIALCVDGDVYSWGSGKNGRLGHGGIANCDEPRIIQKFIVSPEQQVIQVCAADSHSMALNREGRVFSWGSGSYGRLGIGSEIDAYVPTVVEGALRDQHVVSISCNTFHSCAVTSNHLYTWGDGKYGKLGLGHTHNQLTPQLVRDCIKPIRAVCGLKHTVAISINNTVSAWGYADSFRCGLPLQPGDSRYFLKPVRIPFFDDKGVYKYFKEYKTQAFPKRFRAKFVATGDSHSLVLCQNNILLAWGSNQFGQLGTGRQAMSARAILVQPLTGGHKDVQIKHVCCGAYHSVALTFRGDVYTWGLNDKGQLGLGDLVNRHTPTLVKALQGTIIETVDAGCAHSAAIEHLHDERGSIKYPNNKLYTWGDNTDGQCGLGAHVVQQLYPAPVRLKANYDRLEVALGKDHTILLGKDYHNPDDNAIVTRSGVWSCGRGEFGQLGLPGIDPQSSIYEFTKLTFWEGYEGKPKKEKKEDDASRPEGQPRFHSGEDDDEDEPEEDDSEIPRIRLIACGENGCIAVAQPLPGKSMDLLFSWGLIPGLLSGSAQAHPKLLTFFQGQTLQTELNSKKPVFNFHVHQIVVAKNHCLLLAEYNMDASNRVVFAWGETRYGKLGIGNVHEYIETRLKQKRLMASGAAIDAGEKANTAALQPSFVPFLSQTNRMITQMAARADHSLAVSDKGGMVFAWGFGEGGRLGLVDGASEALANQTCNEPVPVPVFKSATLAPSSQEEQGVEGDAGEEGEGSSARGSTAGSVSGPAGSISGPTGSILASQRGSAPGSVRGSAAGSQLGGSMVRGSAAGSQLGGVRGSAAGVRGSSAGMRGSMDANGGMRGSVAGGTVAGGAALAVVGAARAMMFSKQQLAQLRQETLDQMKPLLADYRARFIEYGQARKALDRQKDLLHMVILERLCRSQASPRSLTSRHQALKQKEWNKEQALARRDLQMALAERDRRTFLQKLCCMKPTEVDEDDEKLRQNLHDDKDLDPEELAAMAANKMLLEHSSELTILEELVGRLYLRPCLLFRAFLWIQTCMQDKRHSVISPEELDREIQLLKTDGTELVFGMYDLFRERDIRLMQQFLRLMLQNHVSIARVNQILEQDCIEWSVFSRIFHSGRMRRELSDLLYKCLDHLKPYDGFSPAELLRNYISDLNKDDNDIRTALRKLREKGDELVSLLVSEKFVRPLMTCTMWAVEVLYDILNKSPHPAHPIFGKAILAVFMEVALADMPYQFEMRARNQPYYEKMKHVDRRNDGAKTPSKRGQSLRAMGVYSGPEANQDKKKEKRKSTGGAGGNNGAAAGGDEKEDSAEEESKRKETEYEDRKLTLLSLLSLRDLKEYIQVKYSLNQAVLEASMDSNKKGAPQNMSGGSDMDNEETLARVKGFQIYLKEMLKDRQMYDHNLGTFDVEKVALEREIYKDFLDMRSKHRRYIIQIAKSPLGLICRNANQFLPSLADYKARELAELAKDFHEGDTIKINVRCDPFNTDYNAPIVKCTEGCGTLMHPHSNEVVGHAANAGLGGKADHKPGGTEEKNQIVISIEKPTEHRVPTEDCLSLSGTLSERIFQSSIYQMAGDDSWKAISHILISRRQECMKVNDYEGAHRYESAFSTFRKLRSLQEEASKKEIIIYFGDETKQGVSAHALEPVKLFKCITELSTALQIDHMNNRNRADVLLKTVAALLHEVEHTYDVTKIMRDEFLQLSSSRPYKPALSDQQFRLLSVGEKEKLAGVVKQGKNSRKQQPVRVYIERGILAHYSYSELLKAKVIEKLVIDPAKGFLSFDCVSSMPTTNVDKKNSIQFLKNLTFTFITTQSPDIILFRMNYDASTFSAGDKQGDNKSSGDPYGRIGVVTSKRKKVPRGKRALPGSNVADERDLLYSGTLSLEELSKDNAQYHQFEYDPTGDRVPIQENVHFSFNRKLLIRLLRRLPRPRFMEKQPRIGGGLGGVDAGDVDATKQDQELAVAQ